MKFAGNLKCFKSVCELLTCGSSHCRGSIAVLRPVNKFSSRTVMETDMAAFCIATPMRLPAVTYASQQAALTTCGLAMCMSATETQTRVSSERVVGRRAMLRLAAVAATSVVLHRTQQAQAANVNGRQLVNGVLSAYGLPTMTDVVGLVPLLEQYDKLVVSFDYPTDWLTQRNVLPATEDAMDMKASSAKLSFGSSVTPMEGRASGLTVGDYRKAELSSSPMLGMGVSLSPTCPRRRLWIW
jgi:hypothetical protein